MHAPHEGSDQHRWNPAAQRHFREAGRDNDRGLQTHGEKAEGHGNYAPPVNQAARFTVERAVHSFADAVEAGATFSSERTESVHDAGADDTDHPHES